MKINFFIGLIALVFVTTSCKSDKKAETGENASNLPKNFSLELNVISEKNDDFAMYFSEETPATFGPENAVWSGVKGKPEMQTAVFKLAEDVIPTYIRIDFGIKGPAERGDVILENFKLSYNGKTFERKGSDFLNYFIVNPKIVTEIDQAKGTIKFNKNTVDAVNPYYEPKETLAVEISKLTK